MKTKTEAYTVQPLSELPPVLANRIYAQLRKVSLEQRLLALILTTMLNQLPPEQYKLKYIQKNKARLKVINGATAYVPEIVEAGNIIWESAFTELTLDVGISSFMLALIHRKQKAFKKININLNDFKRLDLNHGQAGFTMASLKVVNKMLTMIQDKLAEVDARISDNALKEIAELKRKKEENLSIG